MRAVLFKGNREIEITDVPDPTPGPGEIVIAIKASGMCGSDLKFYRPPPGEAQRALGLGEISAPFIAGHEPCGVIAERGPGVSEREAPIGARVMDHHYAGCGVCEHCRVGWSQLCEEGFVVFGVTANGAHADYMVAPARTLLPLPDELGFAEGAALSCGTTTAFAALRRMPGVGGSTIAVYGQGPVGLSATLLAAEMGARVVAIEVGAERLALAPEFGATEAIDASREDPVERVKELTHGRGADLALECSGAPAARVAAVRGTRRWGTVCFVGEGGDVTLDVSPDLIRKQLTVFGSWTFSAVGQAECARFVAERGIALERIFTHRFALEQAEEAYRLFDTQTTGKGVFLL